MTSKILGAALLIVLGGVGGYVLASNPHIVSYFHWQQPIVQPVQTDEPPRLNPEMKYRLQERCADRAKAFHQEEYEELDEEINRLKKPEDSYILTIYLSHYNERLNKCFIFAQTKSGIKFLSMEIKDVNSRQRIAYYSFSGTDCEVQDATCKSEPEWWQLVKPYIEELASP